ncbi:hypothetical protein TCDM_08654 [Trypanosoma cruzi Dm28c]|uniref:Uncharacterized protein n=1 Tax=Trypanosoma cruzi Dm28c TaxID=1416333 RepID=V5D7R0_TRYCR|nr:hypothetical protein TCDM_08654 [Trypanosoma cruzi Dm28c]
MATKQDAVFRHPSPQEPPQPESCVRNSSVHPSPQRVQHCLSVCLAVPILAEQLCGSSESKESNGRKKRIAHTQITHHTHTHTASRMGALNHKIKKKKSRSVGRPAHTHSHCSRKAKRTHTEGERERRVAHSMQ